MFEQGRGGEAPDAVVAVGNDQRALGRRDLLGAANELRQREERAPREGGELVFPWLTNVYKVNRLACLELVIELAYRDLLDHQAASSLLGLRCRP